MSFLLEVGEGEGDQWVTSKRCGWDAPGLQEGRRHHSRRGELSSACRGNGAG